MRQTSPAESRVRPSARTEQLAQTLRRHGLRATPAALAVLHALDQAAAPLAHDAIATRLATSSPVDRVTLYRILERMTCAGLIHRFQGPDRTWRFSSNAGGSTASIFACTRCHSMAPLPAAPALPKALAQVQDKLRQQGLTSLATEITVHGLCPRCQG